MKTFQSSSSSKHLLIAGMLAWGILPTFASPATAHEATDAAPIVQQDVTLKGTVVDQKTGEPIIGANVVVKGTTNGVITDIDGNYMLQAPVGSILEISYIGYQSLEIKATAQPQHIELGEDTQALEEVVVVGYGVQKKATVTGSVATVKGSELKATGTPNVTNMFAGKIPGVITTSNSGEPGNDWSDIYIRGKGSLNSNSPLVVIDGVADRNGISNLERLNPNDIESINVLKDASAAIYGAQAANGVILVTTKRGSSANGKPVVNYNGSVTLAQNTRTPDLMNAYEYMVYDDEIKRYNNQTPLWESVKNGYLDGTIDRNQYGDTDWMDVLFRGVAPQTRHSLSINGGTDKVKYYVSGDYSYQEPMYENTVFNYNTYQVRSNIDAQVTKDLKISVNLDGRKERRNQSIYPTSTIFWEAMQVPPHMYDYYPNGLPGPGINNGNNIAILASGKDTGYDRVDDYFINSKFAFELNMPWITEGLSLSGYGAFNFHFRNEKQMWDVWDTYTYNTLTGNYDKQTTNPEGGTIKLDQSHENNLSRTLHLKLAYDRVFGDHHVSAFVAYEQNKYDGEVFAAERNYFLNSKLDYLNFGGDREKTNSGSGYISVRQNFFGRLNYTFKDRYMFEFSIRRDGSMNFAPGHRWGTFPGLSAGWRISEEKFIREKAPFINDLKLRLSWGKLGNDNVDAFQYVSPYVMENGAILGRTPALGKAIYPGVLANPYITWEKVDSKNIGVDGTFWDGMLGFTVEYFFQKRTDILAPRQASIPYYTGLGNTLPDENLGEVNNQGIEFMLSHRNKIGNVNYYVSGNFTFARNKIVYFDEAANIPDWQRETGGPMDTWLMYKTDGIYQTWDEINSTPHLSGTQPGDIKYVDVDGNGEITDNDRIRSNTSNVPEIVYGINYGIEWKGLEVSMLWTGQGRASQMIVPYSYNLDKDFYENRWISAEETPNSKYPRAFNKDDQINTKWSDFWLYDASFIRLKNVEIAYNLPQRIVERLKMQNIRLSLTGTNSLTFDKIKIQDPDSKATGFNQAYPMAKTYSFGVNVTF